MEPRVYTHACYLAAGWGDPNPRYWIGRDETVRRLAVLGGKYASIGVYKDGQRHDIDFTTEEPRLVLAR